MNSAGFSLFEHTADLGVAASAPDAAGLIRASVAGLHACIGSLPPSEGGAGHTRRWTHADAALLLHDVLSEALMLFERDRAVMFIDTCEAEFAGTSTVQITYRAAPLDEGAAELHREVKAVTYHELAVCREADGWRARFIVDI